MNPVTYERIRKVAAFCAWCYFIYLAYMLLHPIPHIPKPAEYVFDAIHFLAFAVLGFLVGAARRRFAFFSLLFLLSLWGVGSEFLQSYTGRYCEFQDMVQNVCGTATGLLFAWFFRRVFFGFA